MSKASDFSRPYRVTNGRKFRLKDVDPGDTGGLGDKDKAQKWLKKGVNTLCDLQEKLYAQDKWGVLLVFQAMDAAGKDGAIKHVMSGVNPQGVQVFSFKAPSNEELDHDFLWRTSRSLPGARAASASSTARTTRRCWWSASTPSSSRAQKLPPNLVGKNIWKERCEDIARLRAIPDAATGSWS